MNNGEGSQNNEISPHEICVLLLDRDTMSLNTITTMLCKSGYRVITARRAAEALQIIRERDEEIDLILAEINLPDMERNRFLDSVKRICKIPVVVMAAVWEEKGLIDCLYKGAKNYLVKPFVMDDLKHLWQIPISCRNDNSRLTIQKKPAALCLDGVGTQEKKRKEREWTEEETDDDGVRRELEKEKTPEYSWLEDMENIFLQCLPDERMLDENKKDEEGNKETTCENGDKGIQEQPKTTTVLPLSQGEEEGMVVGSVRERVAVSQVTKGPTGALSPAESSSDDHMWAQERVEEEKAMHDDPAAAVVEKPENNVPAEKDVAEPQPLVEGELNVSDISQVRFGEVQPALPEILGNVVYGPESPLPPELVLQLPPVEGQGSTSAGFQDETSEELMNKLFAELSNDLW